MLFLTISGYLADLSSEEKLIGANVIDLKSGLGGVTNNFGFFSLTLPADSVALRFSYIGYQSSRMDFFLDRDTSLEVGLDGSEVPGFPVSSSSIVIPDTAKVVDISYGYQKTVDIDGNRADLLNLKIADPAGEENFYGVSAFYIRRLEPGTMPAGDTIMIFLRSDDLVIEGDNPLFFNDATFDGKESSIRINSHIYSGGTDTEQHILVRIYAFSKAYYLYLKSKEIYENAEGNPFAEPSDIYSNMEGGVGIFSINQVKEYVVEIDP